MPLGVLHEAEELLVLRHAQLDLEHLHRGTLLVVGGRVRLLKDVAGFLDQLVDQAELGGHELLDARLQAGERLLALDRGRAGNDQRRARLVDEDGVDFVHDAVPVVALDLVFLARGHAVVAEVVETEFGRGAVGDVARIHLAAKLGMHLLLDAAHGEAEEPVEVAHPLGVAAGEVVVDGDQLRVAAGERVEVKRQRGDEGLALAGRHFGNATLVQRDAADQLDVEMNHVPGQLVVAHHRLGADEPAGGVLHGGEGLRQDLVEGLALFQAGAEFLGLGAELVVGQRLVGLLEFVDAGHDGPTFFDVLTMVPAREFLEEEVEH